jgi:uncharacterized surface protein with fasciclin (FAS1) repeats
LTRSLSRPFTVFAPTNEAFAKLPRRHGRDAAEAENKEMLTKVLLAHVIPGQATSMQLWA